MAGLLWCAESEKRGELLVAEEEEERAGRGEGEASQDESGVGPRGWC